MLELEWPSYQKGQKDTEIMKIDVTSHIAFAVITPFPHWAVCEGFCTCDFHREKALLEWVRKEDHGVTHEKDLVMRMLRQIAHAETKTAYQAATEELKNSTVWQKNASLKTWFTNRWLNIAHVSISGIIQVAIRGNVPCAINFGHKPSFLDCQV